MYLASLEAGIGSRVDWLARYFQNKYLKGNKRLADLTIKTAGSRAVNPKLVYTHLLMPHWPYLQDSLGRLAEYNAYKVVSKDQGKADYLSYLKHTNNFVSAFVDKLLHLTNGKAVIMVMSDHGYRKIENDSKFRGNYNLNAVYLPDQNYKSFYDSVSNVNQFRLIFNTVFKTQLPLKQDSIVF